jgi:hypothetical protein
MRFIASPPLQLPVDQFNRITFRLACQRTLGKNAGNAKGGRALFTEFDNPLGKWYNADGPFYREKTGSNLRGEEQKRWN